MKVDKKYKGLVTKKFNEFYLVELDKDESSEFNKKFLCKLKKSINFRNQFVFVGDEVIVYQIDLQSKRATIESLVKRNNLLERPSVANISNIYVICSVEEPKLNLSQVNKFLISAEQLGVEVSLVLTKCDLITEQKRCFLLDSENSSTFLVVFFPRFILFETGAVVLSSPGIIIFNNVVLPTPDGPINIEHFFSFNSINKFLKFSCLLKFKVVA